MSGSGTGTPITATGTTSGVTSFSVSRNDIIYMAFENMGVYAPGFETPTAGQMSVASDRLNMMIKAWQGQGVGLWLNQVITLPLVADAQYYSLGPSGDHCSASMGRTQIATAGVAADLTIEVDSITGISTGMNIGIELDDDTVQWTTVDGAPAGTTVTIAEALTDGVAVDNTVFFYSSIISRPLSLIEARIKDVNGNETPLSPVSWTDYAALPLKSSEGKTNQYCFKSETVDSKLYVWPVNTVMSDYIVATARMPVQDFVSMDDTPDFPQEWFDALHFGLAYRLCPAFKVRGEQYNMIKEQAAITLADADGFDREQETSIRFVPSFLK